MFFSGPKGPALQSAHTSVSRSRPPVHKAEEVPSVALTSLGELLGQKNWAAASEFHRELRIFIGSNSENSCGFRNVNICSQSSQVPLAKAIQSQSRSFMNCKENPSMCLSDSKNNII